MSQHKVVLLLGSNLGNPQQYLETAIEALNNKSINVLKRSRILTSEPVEFVSSNIFCNIALIVFTELSPIKLLQTIKEIEVEMGRTNDSTVTGCYTDRVIDIDIVSYDNLQFSSKCLEIPHHKHLYEREFSRILLKDFN